jgi:hypothetical protein
MKSETAKTVLDALVQASSSLATTIEDVRPELDAVQFERYTKTVGNIVGSIYLDLMAPIIRDFPDLDPGRT